MQIITNLIIIYAMKFHKINYKSSLLCNSIKFNIFIRSKTKLIKRKSVNI